MKILLTLCLGKFLREHEDNRHLLAVRFEAVRPHRRIFQGLLNSQLDLPERHEADDRVKFLRKRETGGDCLIFSIFRKCAAHILKLF